MTASATRSPSSSTRVYFASKCFSTASHCASLNEGPQSHRSITKTRSLPSTMQWIQSATPSAPPASPAAGCTQMSSKGVSRRTWPLATQLSATPPAITRFFIPVRACRSRACRTMISLTISWIDRATSLWNCSSGPSFSRGPLPSISSKKASLHILRPKSKSK